MIKRSAHFKNVQERFKSAQIVAIIGPRQVGKSTLAHLFKSDVFYDLERPSDFAALENLSEAFKIYKNLIIIDEVQRKPELFSFLRYYVDTHKKSKFLLLGSSSRIMIKETSESLAGRISYYQLSGFALDELKIANQERLWLRGGFPKSYLSRSDAASMQWREDYIRTFLEWDIPQLGIQIPAYTLRRFWMMLAHYNGQIINYSEIGRNFGVSDTTIKKYLDILVGTFMVEQVQPWFANITKRQTKSPKFYFKDTGIFHGLLLISSRKMLLGHPKVGASWESFVLQTLRYFYQGEIFFWNTHADAEIDFLIPTSIGFIGIEAKFNEAPKITPSIKIAKKDLDLKKIFIVYPGDKCYKLDPETDVISLAKLKTKLQNYLK